MVANLAQIDAIMKEVYGPKIVEQLESDTKTLKRIQRSSNGVTNETGGKYVTFPVHTRRNAGIGARHESEALPNAGAQGHAPARVGLKYQYAAIQLTGQAIALSDTNPKAFAEALDLEVKGVKTDFQKDLNRQIYGSGNGAIGVVATAGTSSNDVKVGDARLFNLGDIVDVVTTPSTVSVSKREVTDIDLSTNTVTLDGAAFNSTVGQLVVRNGSGPSSAGNREMTGLAAIVNSSGTIYNIDPSTEPVWKSEVDSNGGTGRALSEGLMIQMADRIRTNGGKTSVIFTSLGVRRAYFNLLSQQRSVVNTQEFTGGFKGLAFTTDDGEIPVVVDVDAPLSTMWFLNEDTFTFYRDEDAHWLDRDGSMWKQVVDANGAYDAWRAYLVEYHELGCNRRNSNGKITDITEA